MAVVAFSSKISNATNTLCFLVFLHLGIKVSETLFTKHYPVIIELRYFNLIEIELLLQ